MLLVPAELRGEKKIGGQGAPILRTYCADLPGGPTQLERAKSSMIRVSVSLTLSVLLVFGSACVDISTERDADSIKRGHDAIERYGCTACHQIGDLPGTRFESAAPLEGVAERAFIAGVLATSPDNLARWIRNPPSLKPGTGMPALAMSERESRDMAAYLYSLH